MAAELGDVSRPLLGHGRRPARRGAGRASRASRPIPRSSVPCEFSQTVELVLGQNNVAVLDPDRRHARGGRDRGGAVLDRDRRAQGAAGPGRLDGPEGRRQAEAGLHGADRGLPALEPAGRRLVGRGRDPREGRTRPSIPLNADGGAELKTWKIVVNGASSGPTGPIIVSSQLAKLTIAAQFLTLGFQAGERRAGQGDRPGREGEQGRRLPGRGQGDAARPAEQGDDRRQDDHQGHRRRWSSTSRPTRPRRPGNHQNLFCQVVVTQDGEPIVHNLGTGQLRIDVPLPPKPNAPAAKPAAARRRRRPSPPRPRRRSRSAGSRSSGSRARSGPRPRRRAGNEK